MAIQVYKRMKQYLGAIFVIKDQEYYAKGLIHLPLLRRAWEEEEALLKVHKREKFFSSDFEFFTILYLVKLKY
jgi:hypothetical protein